MHLNPAVDVEHFQEVSVSSDSRKIRFAIFVWEECLVAMR